MILSALASRRLGGSRDGLDLAFWAWTSVHRRCDRIGNPLHPSSVRMVHLLAGIRSRGHGGRSTIPCTRFGFRLAGLFSPEPLPLCLSSAFCSRGATAHTP